mgnify:CR=1 FL=1
MNNYRFLTISLVFLLLLGCQKSHSDTKIAGPALPDKLPLLKSKIPVPPKVRQPAVAGAFYPSSGKACLSQVNGYLEKAPAVTVDGKIGALICPHAGYMYSGATAARAFKALKGQKFDTVVVVAPSHRASYRGFSVWWKGAYQTPLGKIEINEKFARTMLNNSKQGSFVEAGHKYEHSLEVMLPFLSAVIGDYKLVPVVIGQQSRPVCQDLARAIAKTVKTFGKVLLVGSTDLSHFHNVKKANQLDKHLVDAIKKADAEQFLKCISSRKSEACGYGSTYAVMTAAKTLGFEKAKVTGYDTSATASGDKSRVVGYVSAVLYGTGKAKDMSSKGASSEIFSLSDDEKKNLLTLARTTIEAKVANKTLPEAKATTEKLGAKSGAFVTLKIGGHLRGCIGYIVAVKPLVETIQEMAQSAAFRDPRFPPVQADEVPKLEIEISVLSPFKVIEDTSVIEVGVHGIQIALGPWNRGLLLPQVATEYGWDRQTFLEHTCAKAGLPKDAWKNEDAEIQIFSAEIFNEEEFGLGPYR